MSQDDLMFALTLADRANAVTRARFGALDLRIDTKPDLTPVTDADQAVESELREALGRNWPGDRILGQEFGGATTFSGRQWIIDPIDGTKNFVRGVPVWASLIALLKGARHAESRPTSATTTTPRWRKSQPSIDDKTVRVTTQAVSAQSG